jgi:hypothetical protein
MVSVKRSGKASQCKSYTRTAAFGDPRQRRQLAGTIAGDTGQKTRWISNLSFFPPWEQL